MKPIKTLTIQQPWAHLIIDGNKTIENRSWKTDYRGPLLIHAGRKLDRDADILARFGITLDTSSLVYGAAIGVVDLIDIVEQHPSPYFVGPFGLVLANPRACIPVPMNGKLGLFTSTVRLLRRRDAA
jgi:hypothetical protein